MTWQDRAHFFGLSARLMRRVLVDHARRQRRGKRGGDAVTIAFDEAAVVPKERTADLVAIDDALTALATHDVRKSQIVELRFFGGLSVEETAEVLKVSPRTVKRMESGSRVAVL
jgi:RNA polymerase sigma factor (TIGR02999 family)